MLLFGWQPAFLFVVVEICGVGAKLFYVVVATSNIGSRMLMESRSTDRDNFGASNLPGRPYRRSHMIEISLGQRIRELRDKAALSLRGLAKRIGISSPFLSDIELGRRFPSEEILAKLAGALEVSPDELEQYDTRAPIADLKRLIGSPTSKTLKKRCSSASRRISRSGLIRELDEMRANCRKSGKRSAARLGVAKR